MTASFQREFRQVVAKAGLELSSWQLEQFQIYYEQLIQWNEKINLTAITAQHEVMEKHFLDSLLVAKILPLEKQANLMDVGTGAGFPGLPLKIFCPTLPLVLVDSLQKRLDFLAQLTQKLALEEVTCLHARAEELGKNEDYREKFALVVSRAVARLPVLAEYCLPLVEPNGYFVAYKGPEIHQEIHEAAKALALLGGEVEQIYEFILPGSGSRRSLALIKKIKETPLQYPRKPGLPAKKPLL